MKINVLHIVIAVLAFACGYLLPSRRDKAHTISRMEQTYLQEIADIKAEREAGYRRIDSLEKLNAALLKVRAAVKKDFTTKNKTLDEKKHYYTHLPAGDIDARLLFFAKELAAKDSIPEW
jgi:uncharacterized protein (UPF0305 family)